MTSVSQQNLLKLAEEDERKGDLVAAIQNLEEALRGEHSLDVILKLIFFLISECLRAIAKF